MLTLLSHSNIHSKDAEFPNLKLENKSKCMAEHLLLLLYLLHRHSTSLLQHHTPANYYFLNLKKSELERFWPPVESGVNHLPVILISQ